MLACFKNSCDISAYLLLYTTWKKLLSGENFCLSESLLCYPLLSPPLEERIVIRLIRWCMPVGVYWWVVRSLYIKLLWCPGIYLLFSFSVRLGWVDSRSAVLGQALFSLFVGVPKCAVISVFCTLQLIRRWQNIKRWILVKKGRVSWYMLRY